MRKREPNKHKALNPRASQWLLAYAAMAGAGLAIQAVPARAEIVYTSIYTTINHDFYLDLNRDGINDFHIHSSSLSGIGGVQVSPLISSNRIVATPEGCYFGPPVAAAALQIGAKIGPGAPFLAQASCMVLVDSSVFHGPWVDAKDRYLGLVFDIDGKEHFGWARLSVQGFCYRCIAGITGYAYETVPGRPIVAGDRGHSTRAEAEPPTLGALALGAPGLELWRKDQEAVE